MRTALAALLLAAAHFGTLAVTPVAAGLLVPAAVVLERTYAYPENDR
jgi:hypothetical protein